MTANRLKQIASLKRKRNRDELSQTLVEGVRSVKSLLASDAQVIEILVAASFDVNQHPWLTDAVSVEVVSTREFDRISEVKSTQGIVAVAKTTTVDAAEFQSDHKILAFDEVSDPGNAGAMIRSASWFGINHVLTTTTSVDLFSPKVVRASMGGIWDVSIGLTSNLSEELRRMKSKGLRIACADLEGIPHDSWQPESNGVLIIGSEAHGVSGDVRAVVDESVSIVRRITGGAVESLNAAISCGIILDHWTRSAH